MGEFETKKIVSTQDSYFLSRLKAGLQKTRDVLSSSLEHIVNGSSKIDSGAWEELEEALLTADIGYQTVQEILDRLRGEVAKKRTYKREKIRDFLESFLIEMLEENKSADQVPKKTPQVILVIGINGSGKTTTIGKLAQLWKNEGKEVIVAAGDTFRAGAAEQLKFWSERVGVPCICQKSGSDPSAVAYDAVLAGISRKMDVVLIDTAGRLQNNLNLMEELKKVKRVIRKALPSAPHQTLLVLDASIGQNSVSQAELFHKALHVDGLVMTKLDGTSKGGVLFQISRELKIPVCFIGIGEKPEDLYTFDARLFVSALLTR